LLGKEYAGSFAAKVDRIIEYLGATTTASGMKSIENGSFEPVAA